METVDNTPRVFQANTSARAQVGAKTRNARGASKTKLRALEVTQAPTGTHLWRFCSPRWRLVAFVALNNSALNHLSLSLIHI